MSKVIRLGVLAFSLILVAFYSTEACSCRAKSPVCEAYGNANAVFIGKVVEGKSVERMSDMLKADTKDLTFKFEVSRGFIGAKTGEIVEIHTGFGFGDCGFPFESGEEYIVYAYGRNGQLRTGICSRTTHISRAADDIEGLKKVFSNDGATVSGTATRYEQSSLVGEPFLPLANHKVRLVRATDSKTVETRTDLRGKFAFVKLPAGRYKLESTLALGWGVDDYEKEEFQLNEHGCATKDLSIENDMEIKVSVVDPDGKPVTNTWIEFVPIGVNSTTNRSPKEFSVTNPQGQVYWFDLPPGKYTVSVNFFNAPDKEAPFPATFAPGVLDRAAAQIIEVKPGSEMSDIVIRIPKRLDGTLITGKVFWPDGKPAEDVSVGLTDIRADDICVNTCVETDALGNFQLIGYSGREYKIWARGDQVVGSNEIVFRIETNIFAVEKNLQPFHLILKKSKN